MSNSNRLQLLGDRRLRLVDGAIPEPGLGEAVIALRAAGICGTDLFSFRRAAAEGPWPVVPGHEAAGVVVATGPGVTGWEAGARVLVHPSYGCGGCRNCREGWMSACSRRRRLGASVDGSDADHMVAPARNLLRLPDDFPFEWGMLIACNVGTAWGAVQRTGVVSADTVAIFGAGGVGRAAALFCQAAGAETILADPEEARRAEAAALGIRRVVAPTELAALVAELTEGRGLSAAIDCSGSPAAEKAALDLAGYRARVTFIGFNHGDLTIQPFRQLIEKQLTVSGSTAWRLFDYEAMVDVIRRHRFPLDGLLGPRVTLAEIEAGFALADSGRHSKVVVTWAA